MFFVIYVLRGRYALDWKEFLSIIMSLLIWWDFTLVTVRKRNCRKVMFLQVSVILFTGWCTCSQGGACSQGGSGPRRGVPALGRWCLVPGRLGAGGLVPAGEFLEWRPPDDGYCCRLYASYWNAFLFSIIFFTSQSFLTFTSHQATFSTHSTFSCW